MTDTDLEKRIGELAARCERQSAVTSTGFLTLAEQTNVRNWVRYRPDVTVLLHGGHEACERKAAFFLPFWMTPEDFDPAEYIRVVKVTACFGQPAHRDYMGAALNLGIRREWLGDFWVQRDTALIFCLPTVEQLLLDELTRAGRVSLKTVPFPLSDIPAPERKVKKLTFTVKSLRLDAVAGNMFSLSRTAAAELIRAGAASLNGAPCIHVDAPVAEGDVISLRGRGKGAVAAIGGKSRKDRIFMEAEIYL